MKIGPGQDNYDCSNFIKAPEDFLVAHGVIPGDSKPHVAGVSIEWCDETHGVLVEIEAV
jgi:hypothetical protein